MHQRSECGALSTRTLSNSLAQERLVIGDAVGASRGHCRGTLNLSVKCPRKTAVRPKCPRRRIYDVAENGLGASVSATC